MKRIAYLREEYNDSQEKLAEYLDVTPGTISNWETGRHDPPVFQLARIADLYGVSIDYIVDRSVNKEYQEIEPVLLLKEYLMYKTSEKVGREELKELDVVFSAIIHMMFERKKKRE